MMTLKRFRVTNFRSVMDSGWIDCDKVTTLVGINEAGKSNVILALWKLKPVRDGEIDPLHDMPAKEYSSWRSIPDEITFISADFELDGSLTSRVMALCNCTRDIASIVNIERRYDGMYVVSFPRCREERFVSAPVIKSIISDANAKLEGLKEKTKAEAGIKEKVSDFYQDVLSYLAERDTLSEADAKAIKRMYPDNIHQSATSEIYPHLQSILKKLNGEFAVFTLADPARNADVRKLMVHEMPSFVYYSNYGNLDAQIYLPHAVKWLNNEKVAGIDNSAKVRTLRVLFDFVKLDPQEILDLGKDPVRIVEDTAGRQKTKTPTDEEIEEATKQKEARTILLNSASTELTRKFREWWKQGDYIFRFQADGEFFKIWVSDDKRPEEIELERRSTGLQWFLSFFLVFLVESREAHKGAILLLDEAGLSLHPLAQKDLIAFFDNLAETNQLIYTSHSPFLVDTSNIDRTKVVYSNEDGLTVVSGDLRASDDKLNEKSIYAVHAALGLSVSDILLQGCQPVIVEGPSDQHYFNAIKLYLVRNKLYAPKSELIFIPSGGVRGVAGIASIVSGKNAALPIVILDADESGRAAKKKLLSGLYQGSEDSILDVGQFLGFENGEVEDLLPPKLLYRQIDRFFREVEDAYFEEYHNDKEAIAPQIEHFAEAHDIDLPKGWKVDLARMVKQQLQKAKPDMIPQEYIDKWIHIFERFDV